MQSKTRRVYRMELARLRIDDFIRMLANPATGASGGDAKQEITALLNKERRILTKLEQNGKVE